MHGTFFEGSEKGARTRTKTSFHSLPRGNEGTCLDRILRRATPFPSGSPIGKAIGQSSPREIEIEKGESDMAALVGSLRAGCCPCGRA